VTAETGSAGKELTTAEVAALFRVGPKAVSRWAATGKVDSRLDADGTLRFPAAQFTERLRGTREGAEP
jgi:hypothetical protein